jgi:hypothetical protein
MRTATQTRALARRQAEGEYRVLAVLTWPLFFVIALLATPFPRAGGSFASFRLHGLSEAARA